jgi:pSer/pThr/pTyr-binding forkhead associated (FHA) protein
VSYEENEKGIFWPVYQGKNLVGRAEAAEGLDIEIDHPTTSSQHAMILAAARPGRLILQDLGSTNGTFRGEEKLPPEAKHELSDGMAIRFGGFPVIVKII